MISSSGVLYILGGYDEGGYCNDMYSGRIWDEKEDDERLYSHSLDSGKGNSHSHSHSHNPPSRGGALSLGIPLETAMEAVASLRASRANRRNLIDALRTVQTCAFRAREEFSRKVPSQPPSGPVSAPSGTNGASASASGGSGKEHETSFPTTNTGDITNGQHTTGPHTTGTALEQVKEAATASASQENSFSLSKCSFDDVPSLPADLGLKIGGPVPGPSEVTESGISALTLSNSNSTANANADGNVNGSGNVNVNDLDLVQQQNNKEVHDAALLLASNPREVFFGVCLPEDPLMGAMKDSNAKDTERAGAVEVGWEEQSVLELRELMLQDKQNIRQIQKWLRRRAEEHEDEDKGGGNDDDDDDDDDDDNNKNEGKDVDGDIQEGGMMQMQHSVVGSQVNLSPQLQSASQDSYEEGDKNINSENIERNEKKTNPGAAHLGNASDGVDVLMKHREKLARSAKLRALRLEECVNLQKTHKVQQQRALDVIMEKLRYLVSKFPDTLQPTMMSVAQSQVRAQAKIQARAMGNIGNTGNTINAVNGATSTSTSSASEGLGPDLGPDVISASSSPRGVVGGRASAIGEQWDSTEELLTQMLNSCNISSSSLTLAKRSMSSTDTTNIDSPADRGRDSAEDGGGNGKTDSVSGSASGLSLSLSLSAGTDEAVKDLSDHMTTHALLATRVSLWLLDEHEESNEESDLNLSLNQHQKWETCGVSHQHQHAKSRRDSQNSRNSTGDFDVDREGSDMGIGMGMGDSDSDIYRKKNRNNSSNSDARKRELSSESVSFRSERLVGTSAPSIEFPSRDRLVSSDVNSFLGNFNANTYAVTDERGDDKDNDNDFLQQPLPLERGLSTERHLSTVSSTGGYIFYDVPESPPENMGSRTTSTSMERSMSMSVSIERERHSSPSYPSPLPPLPALPVHSPHSPGESDQVTEFESLMASYQDHEAAVGRLKGRVKACVEKETTFNELNESVMRQMVERALVDGMALVRELLMECETSMRLRLDVQRELQQWKRTCLVLANPPELEKRCENIVQVSLSLEI